jgi:hypothetical protein
LGRTLGKIDALKAAAPEDAPDVSYSEDYEVKSGYIGLALYLDELLSALPEKQGIDIHLSREDMASITNNAVSEVLLKQIESRNLHIRLLVSLLNNTNAMSKLVNTYMAPIVKGNFIIAVTHGMTQAVSNQMNIICGGECVIQVTESTKGFAPPVALVIKDSLFVKDVQKSFDHAMNYAQPLLQIYSDNFSRNILEIIHHEFCMPGDLDVVKDNLCPMYLIPAAYDRVLKDQGNRGEQFKWRSAEYLRFKAGIDANLERGTVFREVLSLKRLHHIVDTGQVTMPALFFMNKGVIHVGLQGSIDMLKGYIDYLNRYENFNVTVVDEIPGLNAHCCWRLKQNHHIAMNYWACEEPFLIYSDHLILTYEFQAHFNNIWMKSGYSAGGRANTIAILNDVIGRLEAKLKV